jgi:hypothetical protein
LRNQASDEGRDRTDMRKIQIFGAFIAVLAFSALAASNASALLLWKKNGTVLTKAETANTEGTVELHHVVLFVETAVSCNGKFTGTVGPEAQDLIKLVLNLAETEKDLLSCSNVKNCTKPIQHALNLPWGTELLPLTASTDDHFFADGAGLPKLEVLCEGGLKANCESLINAEFVKNTASGAEFKFTKAGTETKNCSDGGESWITGGGTTLGFEVG